MELHVDTVERDLEEAFRVLLRDNLSGGDVSLSVAPVRDAEVSGKNITAMPGKPERAPINAFCENGGGVVYLTVGQNTPLEVPLEGRRYTDFAGGEELIALIKAVIAGRFEEDVWTSDSRIIKSEGRIFIDAERPVTIKNSPLFFNPFRSLTKQEYKYQPY